MFFANLAQKNKEKTPEAYEAYRSHLIQKFVRKKYTPEDEIAILRQKETKPQKYQAWSDYVEECIAHVDSLLKGG